MNSLIVHGQGMGVIDGYGALPNYTKCATWSDVKKSRMLDKLVELRLDNVYGMLVLWSLGLVGGLLSLFIETVWKHRSPKS